MWPPTITGCVCEQAGWCERHQCLKNVHWHLLCRLDQPSFELWESGEGPCLDKKKESYAPLPRCVHRGLEAVTSLECELCGRQRRQIPVYECRVFGQCTEHTVGWKDRASKPRVCLGCEQYLSADEANRDLNINSTPHSETAIAEEALPTTKS